MELKLGELPHIVISSPEVAKEMMKTHDVKFSQRPFLLAARTLYLIDISFLDYGEYWRMLRKIRKEELLIPKRVESFRPIREEEVSNLVRNIGSSSGSPVNLSEKIYGLTYCITARTFFGKQCKDQEAFISELEGTMKLAAGFTLAEAFSSLNWLHCISGLGRKYDKKLEVLGEILGNIIAEHEADKVRTTSESGEGDYLLDVLLNFHKNNVLESPLTAEQIKAVILVIINVLEWITTMVTSVIGSRVDFVTNKCK